MGRHLQQALESMRLCASDPLCSEHRPDTLGRGIQGACCHACQFSPETSCERGKDVYKRQEGGATVGLLEQASDQDWEMFTCLNSLRDVEGTVDLVLDQNPTGLRTD